MILGVALALACSKLSINESPLVLYSLRHKTSELNIYSDCESKDKLRVMKVKMHVGIDTT